MKIETGNPTVTGHYVCYLAGDKIPTTVRFWLPGTGWIANLREAPDYRLKIVEKFIGPLPIAGEAAAVEFDL